MHVILIAYHYPPDRAVGALRPAKVAKALALDGHAVTVITSRLPAEGATRPSPVPGVEIRTVAPRRNLRDWYLAWKKRRAPATARQGQDAGVRAYKPPARVSLLRRFIFSLLWFPDDRQGFIGPALREARKALSQHRGPTLVYSTAPPFSSHLAAYRLSRRYRCPLVLEYRDPWIGNPWKPAHVRTRLVDFLEARLERLLLHRAVLVVAVTDGIAAMYRNRVRPSASLLVVRNGIDRFEPPRAGSGPGPLRIVYVGSFYHGRDPRPFLEALAGVRGKGLRPVRVDLVGNCRWFAGNSMEAEAQRLGLGEVVRFCDWVTHQEAQTMVRSADALLLLAQNQPDQVPNKVYEYLGAGRPILAFLDEDGESAAMLRRVGGHYLVPDNNQAAAERALWELLNGPPEFKADTAVLHEWSAENQMRRLVESLQDLRDVE